MLQATAAASGERALVEECEACALWLATAHCEEGQHAEALSTTEHGMRFSIEHEPISLATWHSHRLRFPWAAGRHEAALAALDEALGLVQRASPRGVSRASQ